MAASRKRCSPDRVFAGEYLLNTVRTACPDLLLKTFEYAVLYPWSFVDGIYVKHSFKENICFLHELQRLLKENRDLLAMESGILPIVRHRMILFAKSFGLYAVNAYMRLLRVYLYKVIGKDAYKDGHGI